MRLKMVKSLHLLRIRHLGRNLRVMDCVETKARERFACGLFLNGRLFLKENEEMVRMRELGLS